MTNKQYPKMAEMKNDIREYGLYEVVDDFIIYEDNGYRLSLDVLNEDETIIIVLNRLEDGKISQGTHGMDKKDFMRYDDNDFKLLIGQILLYNVM